MDLSTINPLLERTEERIQAGDDPYHVYQWFSGEMTTYVRANASREATQASFLLNLFEMFYSSIINDIIEDNIEESIIKSDLVQSTEERVLVESIKEIDHAELFEEGEFNTAHYKRLVQQTIQEDSIQIDPSRGEALAKRVGEEIEQSYSEAGEEIVQNEYYGVIPLIERLDKAAVKDDIEEFDKIIQQATTNLHTETQGWPNVKMKEISSL